MASPSPIDAPEHVLQLLSQLHRLSLEQEATLPTTSKITSTDVKEAMQHESRRPTTNEEFDSLMHDKFIALDEDKCQFMYVRPCPAAWSPAS
jgi:hypothetical protein